MIDVHPRVAHDHGAPTPFGGEPLTLACRTYCALCGCLLEIGETVLSRKATPKDPWRVACKACAITGPK